MNEIINFKFYNHAKKIYGKLDRNKDFISNAILINTITPMNIVCWSIIAFTFSIFVISNVSFHSMNVKAVRNEGFVLFNSKIHSSADSIWGRFNEIKASDSVLMSSHRQMYL